MKTVPFIRIIVRRVSVSVKLSVKTVCKHAKMVLKLADNLTNKMRMPVFFTPVLTRT
jgi:hypothetical protein